MAKRNDKESTLEEKLEQALVPEDEWPYKVPKNWVWTRLTHISRLISGRDVPTSQCNNMGEGIPYILGASNLKNNNFTVERWIEKPVVVSMAGDILISVKGTIGKVYLQQEPKINISRQIMALRPFSIINRSLLKFYLEHISDSLKEAGKGVIPGITREILNEIEIPLPPLNEQQRIVDRIESLFAKLDQAKELAQNALDTFETRKAAILHKAFTGELTAKWRERNGVGMESWEKKRISDICDVVRGGSPRPAGDPRYYNGNIPFMKVADITNNVGPYVSSTEYSIKKAGLKKTRMVEANTLLLTNSGATLGVPAICTFQTTINDGIAALLNLDKRSLKFLYYFFISETSELRAINKGAAQPNLNTEIIGSIMLNLPSIPEQQEIVRILDSLFEKEQKARGLYNVIEKIDLMKKVILARAFQGELGTNDPNEDSAVELLKEVLKDK